MTINANKDLIEMTLITMKDCVEAGQFRILSDEETRKKNSEFISEYRLTKKDQAKILTGLKLSDFHKSAPSNKFPDSYLYFFCPTVKLLDASDISIDVDIYIKFEIRIYKDNNKVLVVSFHELEDSVEYPYR